MPLLDAYLRGGLPLGSLTEIVGPSGVGKTQFCHQLSVVATQSITLGGLGEDVSVFYFDTEGTFTSHRLELLASYYSTDRESLTSILDRIIHVHVGEIINFYFLKFSNLFFFNL
eukprot:TRINITY_DN2442_c0_g1_i15.p1 TRINITY_DN2442_c0_g1~~TRINITY_DN2442_c0_g1_i15.p1  ORF type:complete len:114 (-),score=14.54 TRINITY_DN2442_c0_g1_i15:29-370(-)